MRSHHCARDTWEARVFGGMDSLIYRPQKINSRGRTQCSLCPHLIPKLRLPASPQAVHNGSNRSALCQHPQIRTLSLLRHLPSLIAAFPLIRLYQQNLLRLLPPHARPSLQLLQLSGKSVESDRINQQKGRLLNFKGRHPARIPSERSHRQIRDCLRL